MQTLTRECPSDHLHGYPQVHPAKAGMQLLRQLSILRLLYARRFLPLPLLSDTPSTLMWKLVGLKEALLWGATSHWH